MEMVTKILICCNMKVYNVPRTGFAYKTHTGLLEVDCSISERILPRGREVICPNHNRHTVMENPKHHSIHSKNTAFMNSFWATFY